MPPGGTPNWHGEPTSPAPGHPAGPVMPGGLARPPGVPSWHGGPTSMVPGGPGMGFGVVVAEVRHRPGAGAVVGALGLLLVLMSLFGLPWVSEGGQDVSFPDIREIYDGLPRSVPGPAGGGSAGDYFELYAQFGWIIVIGLTVAAVTVATLIVPTSPVGRVVIGCLTFGFLGAIVMALDKKGTVGPKVCGAFLVLGAAAIQGMAVHVLFDETGASPGYGVWLGALGLVAVLVGCLMGTRTEESPNYRRPH